MLKRLATGLGILLLFLTSPALAQTPSIASRARGFPSPPVRARAALVMDADTGQVLTSVNAHLHLPMASTTKIMTAVLGLKLGHLTDRITVPRSAFNFESDATVMGLHPGQVVTLQQLLYGLLLPSGADAANTIAIHYGGSEAHFAMLMNREAASLGMRETHYVNAHGLTAANHYTTAYDLAILGRYASTIPELMKVVDTRYYTWAGHVLTNVNHVLFWYPGVDGIKPGYTDDAGICQVLDAHRDGRHIIVTLLNTPDLVIDARNLLNFGLRDFTWIQSALYGDGPALVQKGVYKGVPYAYFPASGHYVRGSFYTTFFADGGLTTLGFPRTETMNDHGKQVQYFENAELTLDSATHRVHRLPLGQFAVPTATPTPVPLPTPTLTPHPAPEGTVTPRTTTTPITKGTATSGPEGTSTPTTPHHRATPTPTPVSPRRTPTPLPPPTAGGVFASYIKAHPTLLGSPLTRASWTAHYQVQIFQYGALLFDPKHHTVSLLPIGDRLLASRHYLPGHPGDSYPSDFASPAILQAIGWWPQASPFTHK